MRYKDIAVIGMSGRFAFASDLSEYREILKRKTCAIREPEITRLDLMKADHEANYMKCGYIRDIDKFDNEFFGVTDREARLMSPEQRLSLEMAAGAILDAGYSLQSFRGKNCGVFVADGESDYNRFVKKQSSASVIGSQSFMLSGQIGYHLGLQGENVSISSGCSSALIAIHNACEKMTLGEIDSAIVGGVILYVDVPKARNNMYDTLGIMSPDYTIRSFGEGANGTVCGEGGGYILLKPLENAREDGDHIYGVILGGAVNGDGALCTSVSMPSMEQQKNVLLKAWDSVDAEQLTELEAHGIGAPVGDAVEIESITDALKEKGLDKKTIRLSTAKANIGHLFSQSGMASIIKVMTGYEHQETYPIAGLRKLNPLIRFDETSLMPEQEVYHWEKNTPRMTGISSFGLSGCNAHLVVRNYVDEERIEKRSDVNPPAVLKISARTEAAFEKMKRNIVDALDDTARLTDMIYTLNAGRDDYGFRSVVPFHDVTDLKNRIENAKPVKVSEEKCKVIFVVKTCADSDIQRKLDIYKKLLAMGIKSNTLLVDKVFAAAVKHEEGKIGTEEFATIRREADYQTGYEKFYQQIRSKNRGNKLLLIDFTDDRGMSVFESEDNIDVFFVSEREELGRLVKFWYETGHSVNWEGCYEGSGCRRVSAPGYPFEDRRHWAEMKTEERPVNAAAASLNVQGVAAPAGPAIAVTGASEDAPQTFLPQKKVFLLKSAKNADVDLNLFPYIDSSFRESFTPVSGDIDTDYKLAMLKLVEKKHIVPDVIVADKNGRSILGLKQGRISESRFRTNLAGSAEPSGEDDSKAIRAIEDLAKDSAVTVFDFGDGTLKGHVFREAVRIVTLRNENELQNYLEHPDWMVPVKGTGTENEFVPVTVQSAYSAEILAPAVPWSEGVKKKSVPGITGTASADPAGEDGKSASKKKSAEVLSAEEFLEEAWRKAFNLDGSIGHDEDFFSLGGNSLIMQSMSDEINEHFHKKFDIFEIYDYETIEKLAVKILEAV